ncbi:hypothetical protein B296_00004096 [Ensete ventricosum]|uniref:Uncharacterized protein n=1 Tax=Ensete ventricosum TaxID=4639 RepID=A0A427B2M8_ENSVE|nr:hypothetical protein B296_00004096 [Ensete ventricosum]
MTMTWRVDDSSGGCSSGSEALEMKRRRRVRLEGNNDGSKGKEEGMKMRPAASALAKGKNIDSRSCGYGRGLEMVMSGKRRRGVRVGDDSRGCGKGVHGWE